MTFNIPTERVVAVMIGNEWHDVAEAAGDGGQGSFVLDTYVFYHGERTRHLGGEGFRFTTPGGDQVAGPGSEIQAVRYRAE